MHETNPTQLRRSPRRVLPATVLVTGAALAFLTARDGSPPWQLARAILVLAVTVAVAVAVRRAGPGLCGSLAFVTGVVGVAVGAGIALPYLAAGGAPLVTAAGFVALAGGSVLLAGGAAVLLRHTSGLVRVPVALALVVAAYVGLFSGFIAVKVTNVPPGHLGTAVPADRGLAYRDVTFRTADGVQLSGWYIPSRNGAALVVAHGSGSTRSAVLAHAAVLARHGYGVLLYDARGHGRSGGRGMDWGWYGTEDLTAATSYVLGQPDVRDGRVALVGLSMGGEEAVGAAAADPRIRAVVGEGVTGRTAADLGWLADRYGIRGWIQERIDDVTYGVADLLTDARPPGPLRSAVATAAPRPVLLIAAGTLADETYAAEDIRRGSPSSVHVWVVPGSGHTGALATDPSGWERTVGGFLSAALLA